MNVMVINLTRFGDLLQTQPVILGLKAQGYRVGLLCLENFASAAVLLDGVDYVMPLHGSAFLQALHPVSSDHNASPHAPHPPCKSWPLAIQAVEELAQKIQKEFPLHMVVNTTASLSARLFARRLVLAARNKAPQDANNSSAQEIPILGFGLDDHGFGQSGNMWATFLQGASAERLNCPFNIVDMFRAVAKVAHIPPRYGLTPPLPPVQEAAQDFLAQSLSLLHTDSAPKAYVAFQLGASEKRRQWPISAFVTLGKKLWEEEGLCPVLLGSPAEKHLAQSYATLAQQQDQQGQHLEQQIRDSQDAQHNLQHPFIDAIGKTDITQLAALLQHCALIVSNDTGTMHLAAGLQIPVIAIFLATAQAFDTGPYIPNACCLEPDLPCHPCPFHQPCPHGEAQPCLHSIAPQTVAHLVQHFLHHNTWDMSTAQKTNNAGNPASIITYGKEKQKALHPPSPNTARIWTSAFDAKGFLYLKGLSGHEHEERTHWLCLQRQFYRYILDEAHAQGHSLVLEKQHIQGLSKELRQDVSRTLGQCTQLLLLVKEHMQLLQRMPSKQGGQRILNSCRTIYGVLEKCVHLKALAHLWLVLFQERGAHWEHFSKLVHSLRETLLVLLKELEYQEDA